MGSKRAEKGGGWVRTFSDGLVIDEHGFDASYKAVCIDVDGIPKAATSDNCVNECPFGYGIRYDGKIIAGARAQEWIAKEIDGE